MEQVINTIISAEIKAMEILNEAIEKKEQLTQIIDVNTKELANSYFEKQKTRIQKAKKTEEENFIIKVSVLNEKKELEIDNMVNAFNKNCDIWVEALYNKILNG